MNERIINDLAVKSGLAEDMGRGYKFPDNYLDFAELIVKECLGKIENEAAQYAEPVWAFELVNDIKEHFGVEL